MIPGIGLIAIMGWGKKDPFPFPFFLFVDLLASLLNLVSDEGLVEGLEVLNR